MTLLEMRYHHASATHGVWLSAGSFELCNLRLINIYNNNRPVYTMTDGHKSTTLRQPMAYNVCL